MVFLYNPWIPRGDDKMGHYVHYIGGGIVDSKIYETGNAAVYVKANGVEAARDNDIILNPVEGVRYTVPGTINAASMDEQLTVRFRVGGVYKNCYVSAYFGDERVIHRKRPVVAPGEMEEIKLTKEQLLQYPDLKTITVKIERE